MEMGKVLSQKTTELLEKEKEEEMERNHYLNTL